LTTTAEAIKIMNAFLEGKKIEYRSKFLGTNRIWKDTTQPTWAWSNYEYRIAPIQPKPKRKAYAYITAFGDLRWTLQLPYPSGCYPVISEDKEIEL